MDTVNEEMKEFRRKYDLRNEDLAKMFGYSSLKTFNKSNRRKRLFKGLLELEKIIEKSAYEWCKKKSDAVASNGNGDEPHGGRAHSAEVGLESICECGSPDFYRHVQTIDTPEHYTCTNCKKVLNINFKNK